MLEDFPERMHNKTHCVQAYRVVINALKVNCYILHVYSSLESNAIECMV